MDFKIKKPQPFSLKETLDCGQCFRFNETAPNIFEGVVKYRYIKIKEEKEYLTFFDTEEKEYYEFFADYFDLNRDYEKINTNLSKDLTLKKIVDSEKGIRIMNQDPFETLISFIISQNNNIPRIKGIIERLCENFGEKIKNGYLFPTPYALMDKTTDDLAPLRAGFRARYILDAAKRIANNEIDLKALILMPTDKAREELMKICGVGKKVADCTLLFSLRHINAFPKDVWINRAMDDLFKNGLPKSAEEYAGIAQQYIFNYYRKNKLHNRA